MAEKIRSKIIAHSEIGSSKKEIFQKLKNGKVSPKLIYRTIKRYKDTGSLNDKPRSGRPRSVRTPALKNKVRCRISRNPRRSIRKMARELSVNHETMRKLVVEDLGLKSFKRKKVHHHNPSIRTKKLARSKALLQRFAPGAKTRYSSQMRKFSRLKRLGTDKMIGFLLSVPQQSQKPEIHR
ncbi:Transposase [Oopsacas minuta]|uniref:Transposase n=1 Tax=Oopsacas minuta TaxID=111878 RepID=A0AAV7JQS9_9METZ|nr:Transposase [Oopsacas minuta]